MTSASVVTSSAVIHCPLPATFENAVAAVRQALPEERHVELTKQNQARYALVSYDALGNSAVSIAKTEHRGITVQQLLQIEKFIRKHARFWVETFPQSPSFGLPLEFDKFNLYHACYWIISPATRKLCCSLVELVAMDADAQYPWWFVSHAWQEAVFKFVACLRQHAALRNVADGAYWVCAYANNQHKLEEEICANPRSTSFYRAMQLSIGVVLILDEKATPFTRIWCCFEESIAVEERNAGMPLLLDVAATDSANEAHVLTDGLAAAEACRMPLLGFLAKSVREAAFPTPLVQKGLEVDIARADASHASDKTAILNSIRLPRARTKVLSDPAPLDDPNYTAVNQALAAHFALASWFGSVARKRDSFDSSKLLSALAADSFRRVVQLSFTGCCGFTDAELNQLLRHLPRQLLMLRLDMGFSGVQCWAFPEVEEMEMPPLQELSLRFTGSHLANASGLGQMLGAKPMSQSLVELGSWEHLTKLKLEELVLQLNSCKAVTDEARQSLYDCVQRLKRRQRGLELRLRIEGVAERSWPWVPCQRPAVKDLELAGGKSVDKLENFGSETLPFPCSYGGCDIFHSNLSGFCPKHRMWRHCWKSARVWQTAWCWTELSLLCAIQAAAEIEHRATLVAILLSLYPVFCLSLEESVGIPWAVTCALLLVAVICSLVTTSVRFDNMRVQILKQSVATEASYSQVLQLPDSGNMLRVPTMAGCSYPDSSVLHQRSTGLRAMKLVLPNATVKIKLLTHLSNEEQQSPEKVLDALRCELVCEDMLGVQEAFKGLEDRIQSEDLASLQIAAVQDTFAEMSGHKCCQVILQMENYFASVFLMDAFLTRMDNELSSVTKLAAQFGLLDDMKSKWETSSRLWNSVSDVRRPLVLVGTIFLQVLALAMSMFMALQYFLRYAHRIRPQLPDLVLDGLLLDRGEESGETILEAIFLALPYLVLVAVFLQQLVCRKQSRKRPQPTKILYERYFGLRGVYYPVKVAILQGLTVMVQAFGKISLLGGLVTFAQEEQDATAILWLSVGFWAFFALLCWNSLYPAFLLMFPDTAWARIGAAFTDAALDLGYILTYLGMVLVAMLRLRTASEGWGNFGEDLTLQFSNRISPVFAFPTDLLGYCAVYFNLAHACCIAHILQHTTWRLPVRPRGERQKSRCLPRLFGCSLSIGLLSMLMTLLVTQEVFPMTHGRDFTCFPCNCAKNVGSAGQQISSCNLAVVLRQTQVNLAAKNITAVDPKAFSKLGHVQRLSLANN
ncbi:unnamed protein product, partial [Cladocopium goreaui]